jgi:hypothetical protein
MTAEPDALAAGPGIGPKKATRIRETASGQNGPESPRFERGFDQRSGRQPAAVEYASAHMNEIDTQVRLAAFQFLEQPQGGAREGILTRRVLEEGFIYEAHRVPLVGPQGIFKPRVLREMPLSITTVSVVDGETRAV